jgi:hypothetical protein
VRTETPPLAAGEVVVESFATDSTQWKVNGYLAAGAAALTLVAAVVVWAALGTAAGFFLMLLLVPIGALFFLPAIGGIRLATTGPVLTTRRLLQPTLFRGWEVIDLATVAGVGLRYHRATVGDRSYAPGGWSLLIWLEDGTEHSLTVVSPGGCEYGAWSTKGEPKDAAEWQHEWDLMARRLMGQAAIRIAEQVRAVQGPDGPYETRHLELTAGSSSPLVNAYWTPARRLGSLS